MKNIHVLPTGRPSRLRYNLSNVLVLTKEPYRDYSKQVNQNLYITSDEEIKEGVNQWYLDKVLNEPYNSGGAQYSSKQNVIIMTTDQDLIKDGVQAIDDEFLEWFVKNPSCEYVTVYDGLFGEDRIWKKYIIIPKKEPNIIDQWLEKNGNPEITKQVDEEAKKLQKQHLIDMMKQDEELGLYDEPLRKQFSANVEGSKEFNEMCKEEPKERLKKILGTKHPKQEIKLEEIFNDDKKENIKKFIDEINNPYQPNDKLKQAFEKYSEYLEDYENKNTYEHGFKDGAKWQQEQIGKSEFLQRLRRTLSDAEARRLIFETFNK